MCLSGAYPKVLSVPDVYISSEWGRDAVDRGRNTGSAPIGRVLLSHLGHSEPTTPNAPVDHTVMQAWSARYGVTSSLTPTGVGGGSDTWKTGAAPSTVSPTCS